MVSPNSMSGPEGPKSSSSSGSLAAELYGFPVWKGEAGITSTTDDGLPKEREKDEEATLGPVATKPASGSSLLSDVRTGNPRLVAPRSTIPMKSVKRVSRSCPKGPGNPSLILPSKTPFMLKGNIPSLVRIKSGSLDNPIDIDAMQPTRNQSAKNLRMAKGTRPVTDNGPGLQRVWKPALKMQKSVRPSPSVHRSFLSRPEVRLPHPGAALPIASGPYLAAGESVQKLQFLLGSNPSLPTAPYQQRGMPYRFAHVTDQPQPPLHYLHDTRYAHYPVDPRQYYSMPYPISQQGQHHPKHMPKAALAPTDYAKSKYHHFLEPKPADSNTLSPNLHTFHGHEAHLRQRAVQYIKEYSRPRPRKRTFEDPEATSGSEYDTGTNFEHNVNAISEQELRSRYERQVSVLADRNLDLSVLVSHTQLLTDLFHVYPSSRDPAGLREDMESLIAVQNQRFHDWIASEEAERMRKRAKLFNADIRSDSMVYAFLRGGDPGDETEDENEDMDMQGQEETQTEKEVRDCIASTAKLWETKKGEGIVEVFAEGSEQGRRS